jgi:hypothetical protein
LISSNDLKTITIIKRISLVIPAKEESERPDIEALRQAKDGIGKS